MPLILCTVWSPKHCSIYCPRPNTEHTNPHTRPSLSLSLTMPMVFMPAGLEDSTSWEDHEGTESANTSSLHCSRGTSGKKARPWASAAFHVARSDSSKIWWREEDGQGGKEEGGGGRGRERLRRRL